MTFFDLLDQVDAILHEANGPANAAYARKVADIMAKGVTYDNQAVKTTATMLTDVKNGLTAELLSVSTTDSFTGAHLRSLHGAVDRASGELNRRMNGTLSQVVNERWVHGVQDTDSLIRLAAPGTVLPLGVSVDQLLIAQQVAADLVSGVSNEFRIKARQSISLGILGRKSSFSIMQRVADALRTQPNRKGKAGSTFYSAERIVRTESNAVYSLANRIRQTQAADEVPGMLKYWLTAHDSRVRIDHVHAGSHYAPGGDPGPIPFDQPYMVGGEPMQMPHDPTAPASQRINCRCVSVAYKADWFS